jgi:hypothetical protein
MVLTQPAMLVPEIEYEEVVTGETTKLPPVTEYVFAPEGLIVKF